MANSLERRALIGRGVLSLVLLTSFVSKLYAPKELVATLARSELLPPGSESVASIIVLGAEVFTALFLLSKFTARMGLLMCTGLSSLFFGYSLWRWHLDIHAPCSCFGLLLRLEPWQSGLFTFAMCATALACLKALGMPKLRLPFLRLRSQGGRT
jgi:hypothetical protein